MEELVDIYIDHMNKSNTPIPDSVIFMHGLVIMPDDSDVYGDVSFLQNYIEDLKKIVNPIALERVLRETNQYFRQIEGMTDTDTRDFCIRGLCKMQNLSSTDNVGDYATEYTNHRLQIFKDLANPSQMILSDTSFGCVALLDVISPRILGTIRSGKFRKLII